MNNWRLMIDEPRTGAWNMAIDEAILEHVGRKEFLPTLRLYTWQPACLSLGYAQSYNDVDAPRLKARGWDVVRRPTGGRAILHTDELTYSVATAPDEPIMAGTVLESYNRLARALVAACQSLDLPVSMEEHAVRPRGESSGPVCFEVPSAYEIVLDGKKLIGSAQARKREGILQHGTLPLHGDLTRITEALVFETEESRSRASQKLLRRATTVEMYNGKVIEWQQAAESVIRAFESQLGIHFQPSALSAPEQRRAAELVENKYAHPDWTERA